MIKMSPTMANQILGVLQLLPYHVANVIVSKVYNQAMKELQARAEKETPKEETKTE